MIPVDGALAALQRRMQELFAVAHGHPIEAQCLTAMAAVECLAMAIEQAQATECAAHPLHVVTSDPSIEARAKVACLAFWRGDESDMWDRLSEPCREDWRNTVRVVDASRPDPSPELVEALYQLRREALDGVSPERSRAIRARYTAVERAIYTDPEHARVTMTPLDRLRVIAGLVMTLPHGKASHEVALGHDEPAFAMLREAGAAVIWDDVRTLLRATLHLGGVRFTAQKDGEGVST